MSSNPHTTTDWDENCSLSDIALANVCVGFIEKESHLCCSYEMEHRETGVYKAYKNCLSGLLVTVYVFLCVQMVTGR